MTHPDLPRAEYVVSWTTADSDDTERRSLPTPAEARLLADEMRADGYDVDIEMEVHD